MALTLNLSYTRSLDRLSITVTDNTGTGATGYLAPNPTVADFSNFNITITPADPVTYLPTGTPVTVNAFPSLPSASAGTFTILNTDLGLAAATEIPDGVYLFEVEADWENEGGEGTATAENYKAFYEIVGCCIRSMTTDLISCGCSGDSQRVQNMVKANLYLISLSPYLDENGDEAVSPIEQCGQWNKAAEAIRELKKICTNENCQGCGGC